MADAQISLEDWIVKVGAVQTTVGAVACALLALGISTSLLCGLKQTYLGSEGDHYFLLMWKTR